MPVLRKLVPAYRLHFLATGPVIKCGGNAKLPEVPTSTPNGKPPVLVLAMLTIVWGSPATTWISRPAWPCNHSGATSCLSFQRPPVATSRPKRARSSLEMTNHPGAGDDVFVDFVRRIDVFAVTRKRRVEVSRVVHHLARQPIPAIRRNAQVRKQFVLQDLLEVLVPERGRAPGPAASSRRWSNASLGPARHARQLS